MILDQTHNIRPQLVCRIVAASLGFLEPNVARGDGDDRVAVSGCEGDVAVVAGSVDVEMMGTDYGEVGEGRLGLTPRINTFWYYRLVQRIGGS